MIPSHHTNNTHLVTLAQMSENPPQLKNFTPLKKKFFERKKTKKPKWVRPLHMGWNKPSPQINYPVQVVPNGPTGWSAEVMPASRQGMQQMMLLLNDESNTRTDSTVKAQVVVSSTVAPETMVVNRPPTMRINGAYTK